LAALWLRWPEINSLPSAQATRHQKDRSPRFEHGQPLPRLADFQDELPFFCGVRLAVRHIDGRVAISGHTDATGFAQTTYPVWNAGIEAVSVLNVATYHASESGRGVTLIG